MIILRHSSLCLFLGVRLCIHLLQIIIMYPLTLYETKKKKKKKKTDPCQNIGKNIKSYATIPTPHSPGKGGKPHGKKSQSIG